jgi:miniconductance mechanosensitive channel
MRFSSLVKPAICFIIFLSLAVILPEVGVSEKYALYLKIAVNMSKIGAVIAGAYILSNLAVALFLALQNRASCKTVAAKALSQLVRILLWCAAVVVVISILMGKSPVYILSGLGAATAVLMLLFREMILGLVAGMQVAQNDMLRVGDWIVMDKYSADGNVIDIALTTIKVQNWDNTVTMIPASAFLTEAFINWRYMSESKGRRIKRAVRIDAGSIRELTAVDMEHLRTIGLEGECSDYPSNLAAFEAWVRKSLGENPEISQELTCMVRQLTPTENGIPVEIYAFTINKNWTAYENIQTAIFDKLYVTLPKFGLRMFQRSTGYENKNEN